MSERWYIYLIIAIVAYILFWAFDKFKIIKSKPLRILVVLLISSVLCWLIYDLIFASE